MSGIAFHLERVVSAPPDDVFRAFVEPSELAKWWGPAGFTTPSVEMDVREGGSYRFGMQPPEGELFYLQGEFREVDAPTRLVYTFRWEDPDPDDRETVVTVTLTAVDGSTKVEIDQGPFVTEARRTLHQNGWTEGLEKLERAVSA